MRTKPTHVGRARALRAWRTRRIKSAFIAARASEAASKAALRAYCEEHRWKLALFEGPTGSPRTGVVDAVAISIDPKDSDLLHIRFIQLKGGKAGVSGGEIARLKTAAGKAMIQWFAAAFDGEVLHLLQDLPEPANKRKRLR